MSPFLKKILIIVGILLAVLAIGALVLKGIYKGKKYSRHSEQSNCCKCCSSDNDDEDEDEDEEKEEEGGKESEGKMTKKVKKD